MRSVLSALPAKRGRYVTIRTVVRRTGLQANIVRMNLSHSVKEGMAARAKRDGVSVYGITALGALNYGMLVKVLALRGNGKMFLFPWIEAGLLRDFVYDKITSKHPELKGARLVTMSVTSETPLYVMVDPGVKGKSRPAVRGKPTFGAI